MNDGKSHVGFNEDVPSNVVWSEYSYIQTVTPVDARPMKGFSTKFFLFCIGLILMGGILLVLSWVLKKYIPDFRGDVLSLIGAICIPSGIISISLLGYILKIVMTHKIGSRSERLFEPGKDCFFVGVENAFTYDKMKLTADDFGLLRISPNLIQLEMTNHSAQFRIEDLNISILHSGQSNTGVRLTVKRGDYPWSVVLSPMGNSNYIKEASPSRKAQALFDKLAEASEVPLAIQIQDDEYVTLTGSIIPEGQAVAGNTPVIETENADLIDKRYEEVLAEIRKKQEQRKKGWIKNIGILAITLLLFLQLGKMNWGGEFVVLVLVVLLVHEGGHYLGMKIFGYRDIRMFFIPMMGAAVSGRGQNVAGWKKAIVYLLGPLPGIGISMVLFIVYMVTGQQIYSKMGLMFLLVNVLNLLPIFPLDGGRFLQEVLFSRNRFFELAVNVLAALLLLLAGFATGSWVLKILGFLNLVTIHVKYKLSIAAKHFKAELSEKAEHEGGVSVGDLNEDDIPENFLKQMIDWIYKNMPGSQKAKTVATTSLELWDRIRIKPPKVGATLGLLFVFGMGYFFAVVSLAVFAVAHMDDLSYTTQIVEYQDEDGRTRYKENSYYLGKLAKEVELSDDKEYYHGSHTGYYREGDLRETGQWEMGRKTGQWQWYEPNSLVFREVSYEGGRVVLEKILEGDQWTEFRWADYSDEEKKYLEVGAEFQHGPGKVPDLSGFEFDPNTIPMPNEVELDGGAME